VLIPAFWPRKNLKGILLDIEDDLLPNFHYRLAYISGDLCQIELENPNKPSLQPWTQSWKLKQLTERGQFRLTRFTPGNFEDRGFYQAWPIQVGLDGTYHELGLLFDRLSRFSRIINVTELLIQPMRSRTGESARFTIHADFTQQTFIFKEDNAEAEE